MAKKKHKKKKHSSLGYDTSDSFLRSFFSLWLFAHVTTSVIFAVFFIAGILSWIYTFSLHNSVGSSMLWVEFIVNIALLAAAILGILFVGYDDRVGMNFSITYLTGVTLCVIGFYIARVDILHKPDALEAQSLYGLFRFLLNVFLCMSMEMLPAFLITLIAWIIVKAVMELRSFR